MSSCELDNYEAPDRVLDGKVVDAATGEPLQTRQPDGIKIRLIEEGATNPVPYDFWAKSDGTFRNAKVFAGRYKVSVLQGAFEDATAEQLTVDMGANQNITLKVNPFVRLNDVAIVKTADGIKATYKLAPNTTKKILRSMLICYTSPILHENTSGKLSSATNNLSDRTHADIAAATFADEIKNLKPGETYYARVAVLAENSLNRYNYSPIIKITM